MLIDCVLTACNLNSDYTSCIPVFIKCWKTLLPNIDIKIVLISNDVPEQLVKYKNHIELFSPIDNVSDKFISQYVRLLYPATLSNIYKNSVLITDIDMIPLSSSFFTESVKNITDDKFVSYRQIMEEYKEIAICYNVGTPNSYQKLFNLDSNVSSVKDRLYNRFKTVQYDDVHGGQGWNTDQRDLYDVITANNDMCVILSDVKTGFNRLNRDLSLDTNVIMSVKNGVYTDYHMLKPYDKYKETIDLVSSLIYDNAINTYINKTNYLIDSFTQHFIDRFSVNTVVEVGARDGLDAINLAKFFPNAVIHTFECNPDTVNTCKQNITNSKQNNIIFINKGLSDVETELPFYSYKLDNSGASSFYKRIDFDQTQQLTGVINVIRLKDYIQENIDLLCLDVQGFELNVLKGSDLSKIKYVIMEEPNPIINTSYLPSNLYSKYIGAPTPAEIKQFMIDNGFIEIKRVKENEIEDNVMYFNTKLSIQ